ncbi:MAG TPA: alpha/beta family hydrolase, partial [Ramlibacter sp.]|uniref:alpha/beta family hydrolase n=1 Tax=Ramlibacter sp. TaxID=1917967 RepID=UPI002D7ED6D9
FGFPLHPAGKPSVERAEHLARVELPMLFLQGTRDALADLDLVRATTAQLGERARCTSSKVPITASRCSSARGARMRRSSRNS